RRDEEGGDGGAVPALQRRDGVAPRHVAVPQVPVQARLLRRRAPERLTPSTSSSSRTSREVWCPCRTTSAMLPFAALSSSSPQEATRIAIRRSTIRPCTSSPETSTRRSAGPLLRPPPQRSRAARP